WLHVDVRQSRYMRRTTARWKNSKRMEDLEYPAATLLVTPSGICDLPSPPYNPVSSLFRSCDHFVPVDVSTYTSCCFVGGAGTMRKRPQEEQQWRSSTVSTTSTKHMIS
ncbi:hypothetical protein BHM03_00027514, partial [Ensete ventricosum]